MQNVTAKELNLYVYAGVVPALANTM